MMQFEPAHMHAPHARFRRDRGRNAHFSGLSAEEAVARHLERAGHQVIARRWRGIGGEIDLVCRDGPVCVFVEVKKAHSFDAAQRSLRETQMIRIRAAAAEYLQHMPQGQLTPVRFDLALLDSAGAIRIIENAFGHF